MKATIVFSTRSKINHFPKPYIKKSAKMPSSAKRVNAFLAIIRGGNHFNINLLANIQYFICKVRISL